jgi:RNA polymerase sigma factor (sigma-70 family)
VTIAIESAERAGPYHHDRRSRRRGENSSTPKQIVTAQRLSDFGGRGCLLGEMSEAPDAQLLREYVEHGDDDAFRRIVGRYTDAVYSAALRQVISSDVARDVSQSVFTDLARKAPVLVRTLDARSSLLGWLYGSTRLAALNHRRKDRRRQARERLAMQHFDPAPDPTSGHWEHIGPVLDEAMADLSKEDREALLLRFFQRHDFRAIGQSFGVSDDAAQKRVSRALEKLRAVLTRRGLTTSAAALSVVLSAHVVQAAPTGLAAALSNAALATSTLATSATITVTKTLAMTTLQKTIIGATLAGALGTGVYEARQASVSRSEVQILQHQQAPLTEKIQQLTREGDLAARKLAALQNDHARLENDNARLSNDTAELQKLRSEVTRLRSTEQPLRESGTSPVVSDDAFTQSVLALTQRAGELNQHLESMPDKKIPELQFLTESDWLSVAKDASFATEPDVRQALSKLRNVAKAKFGTYATRALDKFIAANNGQLPANLSQLKPYFDVPVEDAILQRYQVLQTSDARSPRENWVMRETAPADRDYELPLHVKGWSAGG